MHERLISIFIYDEVDDCRQYSVSTNDFSDDEFAHTVAFLVPLSRKRFFFGISWHVPLFPLFGIVNESSYYVGEIGKFFEIADSVPVTGLYPIVRIHWLSFTIDVDFFTAFKEVTVLFLIDFFQAHCHHETQQELILFEEPSAGVAVYSCLEFISDSV